MQEMGPPVLTGSPEERTGEQNLLIAITYWQAAETMRSFTTYRR